MEKAVEELRPKIEPTIKDMVGPIFKAEAELIEKMKQGNYDNHRSYLPRFRKKFHVDWCIFLWYDFFLEISWIFLWKFLVGAMSIIEPLLQQHVVPHLGKVVACIKSPVSKFFPAKNLIPQKYLSS